MARPPSPRAVPTAYRHEREACSITVKLLARRWVRLLLPALRGAPGPDAHRIPPGPPVLTVPGGGGDLGQSGMAMEHCSRALPESK